MRYPWTVLKEILGLTEVDEPFDDDEKPLGSNPFDPPARSTAKVQQPVSKMQIGQTKKPLTVGQDLNKIPQSTALPKPNFPGKFLGQIWKTHGKVVPKRVSWQDKASGEWRGRTVQQQTYDQLIWDGEDWVTPGVFKLKFPNTQPKE